MSRLSEFVAHLLGDHAITDAEVSEIRDCILRDGRLDLDDVKLLVELYCTAGQRAEAFDDLFFSVLERVVLEDGEVQPAEQFYLLKMVYADRVIRPREKDFLKRIQSSVRRTPELDSLVETALTAKATDWDLGGR